MLEQVSRVDSYRQVFRLASIPQDEEFLAELGLDTLGREELTDLLAEAGPIPQLNELLDGPFRRRRKAGPSRFSDGSFSVLYTSLEPATAEAEVVHWLPGRVGNPSTPRVVYYSLFSCAFEGSEADLRPKLKDWPDLVHESDYSFCNRIGAEARSLEIDGLVTWSARRKGGTNVPVFSRKAVSRPDSQKRVALTYEPSSGNVFVRYLDD
ncbi:MAG: RES family NAD+ phosphorylase [Defluviicoccus sp.]|nr:RES family NAD+ phosphorylase [Defluviicoccus sp.]